LSTEIFVTYSQSDHYLSLLREREHYPWQITLGKMGRLLWSCEDGRGTVQVWGSAHGFEVIGQCRRRRGPKVADGSLEAMGCPFNWVGVSGADRLVECQDLASRIIDKRPLRW
jgi:hypothetical protein